MTTVRWATVEAVLIADRPDTFVTRRVDEVRCEYGGIPGDLHFGLVRPAGAREPMYPRGTEIFNRRQISILSQEECEVMADRLGIDRVSPEWLGANLLLAGVPELTKLPPGARLLFSSGAGLYCEGENLPCLLPGEVLQQHHPDEHRLAQRFVKAAYGRRGIVCSVERPGRIGAGDQVKILLPR